MINFYEMDDNNDPKFEEMFDSLCSGMELDVASEEDIERIGRMVMQVIPEYPVKEQLGFATRVDDGLISIVSDRLVDGDGAISLSATVSFHSEDLSLQPEEVSEFTEEKPYFAIHFDSSSDNPTLPDKSLRKFELDVAEKVIEQSNDAKEKIDHEYVQALFDHFINLGKFALGGHGDIESGIVSVGEERMYFEEVARVAAFGLIPIMRQVRERTMLVSDEVRLKVTTVDYTAISDSVEMPDVDSDPRLIIEERVAGSGSLILRFTVSHGGYTEAQHTDEEDDYELDPDELDDFSSYLDFGQLAKTDADRLLGYLETIFDEDSKRAVEELTRSIQDTPDDNQQ